MKQKSDKKKERVWTVIEGEFYIPGRVEKGLFSENREVIQVIPVFDKENGEIRFLSKKMAEKIGLNNIAIK